MILSRDELNRLTADSADPTGWVVDELTPVRSRDENAHLTDEELVQRINEQNGDGEPTYKLRLEYERRLKQRDYDERVRWMEEQFGKDDDYSDVDSYNLQSD